MLTIIYQMSSPNHPSPTLRAQDGATFGRLLRRERKALGRTLGDVAEMVGTSRQTVADLEAGKNVGLHIVFGVLAALGKMVAVTDARPDLESIRALMEHELE